VGSDFLVAPGEYSLDGQELLVAAATAQAQALVGDDLPQGQPARLFIPLLGRHQVENAAVAHAALLAARSRGLNLSQEQIAAGFRQVSWPGRFEVLRRTPPVVIDSAHNRDSACKLRQALADYFPDLPVILVFGASEDKDIQGMFAELLPYVRQVIVVKSFHPRAADPALLAEQVRQHGLEAQIVPDVADALGEALRLAAHSAVTLVAGSIFVAAGARIAWFNTWSKYEES
jgi:dihydrofolate synthase/folylpolyglutamate synthase